MDSNINDIITEIIEIEYKITIAVLDGHRPHTGDKFEKDRARMWYLRNKLNLKGK